MSLNGHKLDTVFKKAVKAVQSSAEDLGVPLEMGYDHKLTLYALYKQSTAGDVQGERPGLLDFTGRAKWDAWAQYKGTPMRRAKTLYISAVRRLVRRAAGDESAAYLLRALDLDNTGFDSSQEYSDSPSQVHADTSSDAASTSSTSPQATPHKINGKLNGAHNGLVNDVTATSFEDQTADSISPPSSVHGSHDVATVEPTIRPLPHLSSLHSRNNSIAGNVTSLNPLTPNATLAPGATLKAQQHSLDAIQASLIALHERLHTIESKPSLLGRLVNAPMNMYSAMKELISLLFGDVQSLSKPITLSDIASTSSNTPPVDPEQARRESVLARIWDVMRALRDFGLFLGLVTLILSARKIWRTLRLVRSLSASMSGQRAVRERRSFTRAAQDMAASVVDAAQGVTG